MKYIDAEKLKNEIKRQADLYQDTFIDDMRDKLIDFIDACIPDIVSKKKTTKDSLQQEQPSLPDNLDEAAEEYLKYHKLETASIRKLSMYRPLAFKAGAEWQKEQMMKEAVEGYVNYYEDSGGILMAEAQVGCPYHNGDKVRIVVLKAEEEGK